ncbi:MAG TPA: glycosyltransferase, partial [Oscillatoriaceae cyanobacterium]
MLPRLSACLIVENAAGSLSRCLLALKDWADQVVVLDRGSTDDTVAIAESFGTDVYHCPEHDDAAAARNAAATYATGDWILALDADEALLVEDAEAFRAALADPSQSGYVVRVMLEGPDGACFETPEVRLFRRDPRLRFRGRLHAQVSSALADHRLRVGALPGVSLRRSQRPSTPETLARGLRLAELDAAERPHAPDAWLALATSHSAAGDDQEALAVFEQLQDLVARTGESDAVAFERARSLAALYTRLERPQDAESVLDAGLECLPDSPALRFERARLREGRGELQGAIADLLACLQGCQAHALYPGSPDLAAQAQAQLSRLVAQAPELAGKLAADQEAELRARLTNAPRQPGLWLELGFRLFQQARSQEALQAILQAIELDAGLVPAFHLLGMMLDQAGYSDYAGKAFAASLVLEPNHPMALSCLEACRGKSAEQALDPELGARIERLLARIHVRLSACLIVKNEAEKLPRCLASLKDHVDEIVVVDTGSDDETVAIAESFGARVHHFAWCDDFSAARNAALEQATGDWILAIDADEELRVDDAEGLRRALRNRTCGGYLVTLHNLGDAGIFSTNLLLRLFQRHERIRYANRLHEHVTDAINALGWPVAEIGGIEIMHDGYRIAPEAYKDKVARNRRIVRAAAEAEPDHPQLWFELGRLLEDDAPDEALTAFERVERLLEAGATLSPAVYPTYVTAYQRLLRGAGRAAEALALLHAALKRYPGHAELHYERGVLRAQLGELTAARLDFVACLTPNAYIG